MELNFQELFFLRLLDNVVVFQDLIFFFMKLDDRYLGPP